MTEQKITIESMTDHSTANLSPALDAWEALEVYKKAPLGRQKAVLLLLSGAEVIEGLGCSHLLAEAT